MVESLRNKTVKGVAWSGVDNVVQHGVSFIVSIVLARLLSPDDYGLLGIIAIFTAVCNAIINGGFGSALIQKKIVTDEDYNTTFLVNLFLSIVLYVIMFYFAPTIAFFFGRVELILLTRVSSISFIAGSLGIVQQTILTKQIDFKTQTKISLIASLLSGLIGIGMALCKFGVWALVAQILSLQIIRSGLFFVFNKWVPRLSFSYKSFHSLFGFGWKIMVSNLLNTIWNEMYMVVVGKFYSPAALGQYTRGRQFAQLFSSNLTTVVQRVTFPVLSNIQDDKNRMIIAYRKIIKNTMFVTAPSMFFLGAISGPLLYCLIGPKWLEAATYLPLLCIAGSLYPLHSINLNMLQVQGRSDLYLLLEIIKKVLAFGPLFIGAFVGIMPMLWANLLFGIVSYFLNSYYSGKFLGYTPFLQLRDIMPSYFVALIVASSVYFLKYIPISNWVILPLQIVVGVFSFFMICFLTKLKEYKEMKSIALPILKKCLIYRK